MCIIGGLQNLKPKSVLVILLLFFYVLLLLFSVMYKSHLQLVRKSMYLKHFFTIFMYRRKFMCKYFDFV